MAFQPGKSGNPNGRPVNPRGELNDAFLAAIKKVEKKRQVQVLEYFVERALKDDTVLVNLMRKLLPDLKSIDALVGILDDRLAPDEAARVRAALGRSIGVVQTEITTEPEGSNVKERKRGQKVQGKRSDPG